ncbi:Alpha-L-fucosidase [Zhouia amylolytica]|uniref:alpha-L-fucosidase n=1 Tax=Zhouia amylolytica TaxID=376730 RepID=A0A1I6RV56_9FLAO|nr:alpha-L-fucosidase [Zhouia amylolytica]SFS68338.1 Alpha-L-fucosidase [Zhouia amylolytica]
MLKRLCLLLLLALMNSNVYSQEHSVDPLAQKLQERPFPEWFKDAKLGIFIHWGLYSVPAYGGKESYSEWFLRGLQTNDPIRTEYMKKNFGPDATYKDLAPHFKAELWDPQEWAQFFKKAGAKYVVLVSKHHDGYALWPSKFNRNWNSVDVGPKRDIVGELTEAVREEGLKMGLYYSLSEWNHPLHRWYTDPHDSIGRYVEEYMIPQFKEVIGTYKPSLIFSDGEWFNTAKQWHAAELIDWYYNLVGDEAIVNNRWGHGLDVGFLTPEYSAGIKVTDRPWTEVRGIGRSFGLNRNENLEAYGTSAELIHRFVQTVANGGGMIINVGPKADGQIPLIQQERLVDLGNWLALNGEAIYGAQPYIVQEQEKDVQEERIDSVIKFNWVRNSPVKGIKEDYFTAEWNGYIVAPQSGKFNFEVKADDEAAVWIDGKAVINQNIIAEGSDSEVMEAKTGAATQGSIKLKKGNIYPIKIKYKENKQNAHVSLFWSAKGLDKEVVPSDAFYVDINKSVSGLKGVYTSKKTYLCYTQNNNNTYAISFEWPDDELILEMPNPGMNATIKLIGLEKDLRWKYENGAVKVNTSEIKYSELPSHMAWTFKISK